MPKFLSDAAIRQFHDHGYYSPVPVLDADEIRRYQHLYAEFAAHEGGRLLGAVRNKSHLFLRWLYELVTTPRILDAVEDLIGPNILLYHAQWFIKAPHTPDFVSLHQDSAYLVAVGAAGPLRMDLVRCLRFRERLHARHPGHA
jgi:non-heme Fe2+,alpha-ketoglutarate-dependent halogenase